MCVVVGMFCKMYTMVQHQEWAPQDPRSEFSRVYVKVDSCPNNTPIKVVRGPVYDHKWLGIGGVANPVAKKKRIEFHCYPITPNKEVDVKIIRKEL